MNTYGVPIRCIICGDRENTSSEGTTQGDPLAMAMYALAVKPLIRKRKSDAPGVKQVWYAEDTTGTGTCPTSISLLTASDTLEPLSAPDPTPKNMWLARW